MVPCVSAETLHFEPSVEGSVLRVDQLPLPRIEELFARLHGCTVFSKIDLSQAYSQVCLDDSSKQLVTITTHKGLFSYERFPFGVASAPAKF